MVIRFRVGVLVALAASGLVLAGCASGPSQVDSAAIVGGSSISVDQVQQELNTVLNTQPAAQQAAQQGKLDVVTRSIIRAQVLRTLIGTVQQQEHIVVTDEQVDQLIQDSGGADKVAASLDYDSAGVRDLAKDQLVEEALGRKYADRLTVNFDDVAASSRADAIAKADKVAADPSAMAGLVKAAGSQGGEAGASSTLAQYLQAAAAAAEQQQPAPDLAPLFGAAKGSVVAFQPVAQDPQTGQASSQWAVVLITGRMVGAAPKGQSAADTANPQDLVSVGQALLQPIAQQAGIRISPRYGVWDYVGMQLVPTAEDAVGVILPTRTATQP